MARKRKGMTASQRLRFFEEHKGICHICERKIQPGEPWDRDHVIPLELEGLDEPSNWRPAHDACHAKKTRQDIKNIRKAQRVKQKHYGIEKTSRKPMPGSRRSKWKRKMDGTTILRSEDERSS